MTDAPSDPSGHSARGVRGPGLLDRAWVQVLVLLAVCVPVYWLGLDSRPLDFSEGHRAVPGWTMLASGDWWHIAMFERTYIRKPPGMAWAIAASSALLGESVLAARAVSALAATLMPLVVFAYARRWWGGGGREDAARSRVGLYAGLAQALFPAAWAPGRSAEIEMLLLLGTQLMALGFISMLLADERPAGVRLFRVQAGALARRLADLLAGAGGLVIAVLAKGPAAAPVLIGVLVAAVLAAGTVRVLLRLSLLPALAIAAGVLWLLYRPLAEANSSPDAVREDVARQFLWSAERVVGVLGLAPAALVAALPAALAVPGVLLFGPARVATRTGPWAIARALALAWLVGVGVLVVSGVSNHRYALPLIVLLPPLAGWVLAAGLPGLSEKYAGVSRAIRDGRPWLAGGLLAAGLGLAIAAMFPTEDQRAGFAAARRLGEAVPPGVTVWADDAIEARPDILWEFERFAGRLGKGVRVYWAKPEMTAGLLPSPGDCMLIRTDPDSPERDRYAMHPQHSRMMGLITVTVRRHQYTLVRVAP